MYYELEDEQKVYCKKCQQRFKKNLKMSRNRVPHDCQPPKNYKMLVDQMRNDKFVNIKEDQIMDEGDRAITNNIEHTEKENIYNRLLKDV